MEINQITITEHIEQRFWQNVKKNKHVCWIWKGKTPHQRYGQLNIKQNNKRRPYAVHRISWLIHYGYIPKDLKVLHKCDNYACVRPDHLFLGTQADNVKDMWQKGRAKVLKGSQKATAKLTEQQVMQIKQEYKKGMGSILAKKYGISKDVILTIVNNKAWKHVQTENKVERGLLI